MANSSNAFFGLQSEQSRLKSIIVSKYFGAWAKIMLNERRLSSLTVQNRNIQYMELYCGPGQYGDGSVSTPVMVLETALKSERMSQHLVASFLDCDADYCSALEQAFSQLQGIDRLKHRPRVYCQRVGADVAAQLQNVAMVPTLLFADPWGYAGLSLSLFEAVLKDFGSECLFFFNYNRVNAAVTNPKVARLVDELFGVARANRLRQLLPAMSVSEREDCIMAALYEAFQESSKKLVLPFCFRSEDKARTSHYLVYVTKHFRGYDIMREIMAAASSSQTQGVPTFTYDPRDRVTRRLFDVNEPLTELKRSLLSELAGRSLTVGAAYEEHSVGRNYIKRNFKDALRELLADGMIQVDRPPTLKTFADTIRVTLARR
jgi:three-Cys-motif partner protein